MIAVCVVCGTPFEKKKNAVTCQTPSCRKLRRREYCKKWERERKKDPVYRESVRERVKMFNRERRKDKVYRDRQVEWNRNSRMKKKESESLKVLLSLT